MEKIQFNFRIDKKNNITLTNQLIENIKNAILKGGFKSHDKLPSIRVASNTLDVSKSVIINAYLQLVTEGFIENIEKKGFYISHIKKEVVSNLDYDLEYNEDNIQFINDGIDKNCFDNSLWKKYYNNVLFDENIDLLNAGDEQGEFELRHAISNFIKANRGLKCTPQQIIIGSGIQTLLEMIIRVVGKEYNKVALESPGYKKAKFIFEDYNFNITNLPVLDDGVDLNALEGIEKALIYTSPAYQYPMGKVMSIDKRLELIHHANEKDCLIIEDDYASTIRYEVKPVPSLQGLDFYDNTMYIGSFSKTLLPSLRISFMVMPKKYLKRYYNIKSKYTNTCSKIAQIALANFIKEGQFEKHLKRINKIYKQKNIIISNYIKNNYGNKLIIKNNESGFHMILEYKASVKIDIIKQFHDEFLNIEIINTQNNEFTFLFNYTGIKNEEIPIIIEKMAKILHI